MINKLDRQTLSKTFEESEHFYQELLEGLPAAIYACDAEGYVQLYNKAAIDLWGNEPQIGKDQWCGSYKIFNTDGSPVQFDECPMAICIKEGRIVSGEEVIVERPNGSRLNVIPHPVPIKDAMGNVVGAINMLLDITVRKAAEQELRESEDRLNLATELAGIATWDLDLQTYQINYSRGLASLLGLSESKLLTFEQLRGRIHPQDLPIIENAFATALTTGICDYEARLVLPNNSMRWLKTLGKIKFNDLRKPMRMVGVVIDITDQKEKEEKIAHLSSVVQHSNDAIINKNLDGIIIDWNNAAERMFGYKAAEMIGQSISKLIPPDRENEEAEILQRIKRGEKISHFETKRITKDKRLLDMSLTICPTRDAQNGIVGASKIACDVTKQREAERLIAEGAQKFHLLANAMPQHVWTADANGEVNFINQSMIDYLGLTVQGSNFNFMQMVHPADLENTMSEWKKSIATGTPFQLEHRFRGHDREYHRRLNRAFPQKDNTGKIQMWVGTSVDLFDKKMRPDEVEELVTLRTQELKLMNDELTRSNAELASFSYAASHDLQEPLRRIQTLSSLVIQNDEMNMSIQGKDYLKRAQNESLRMQTLIEDLLDYSKLTIGEKKVEKVNLNELLLDVMHNLKETIEAKGAIIRSNKLPTMKIIPFQFHQLFTNLLGNSLKYARQGVITRIMVQAEIVKGQTIKRPNNFYKGNYVKFTIIDNGIGFDPKYNDLIFKAFQRLQRKDEYPGTGIGLAICKRIVENHSGFIDADAKLNQGAKFTFHIPK